MDLSAWETAGRDPSSRPRQLLPGMLTLPSGRDRDRDRASVPFAGAWQGQELGGTLGREGAAPVGLCSTGGSSLSFLTQTVLAPDRRLPPCSQPQRTSQDSVTREWRPLLTPGWPGGTCRAEARPSAHQPHPLAVSDDPWGHLSPPGVGQLPGLCCPPPHVWGSQRAPPPGHSPPQVAPYLDRQLFRRLWLPVGWAVSSCRAVAPRTVFPGIPNVAPKGFLGKLDPEGTATRALRQPRASLLLAGLCMWLMGVPALPRLPHKAPSFLCHHSCRCPAPGQGSRAGTGVPLLQGEASPPSAPPCSLQGAGALG